MVRTFKSIVGLILNYNSLDDLKLLLSQIDTFNIKLQIVVVDNKSDSKSKPELRELTSHYNFVHLIELDENKGYAVGNNVGFRYIDENFQTDYTLVMNPDIYFDESTLDSLYKSINADNRIAIVGCKMVDLNNDELLSAWKLPSIIDNIIISVTLLHKIIGTPIKYKTYNHVMDVDVIQGAMFLARLDILKEVDYFSERTFLYMEESILGQKLKELNYRLIYFPEAEFIHKVGGSINLSLPIISSKYRVLTKSRRIYHKYICKDSSFSIFIFDVFSFIGLVEKLCIDFVLKLKFIFRQ